jgi:hypothetical protein
MNKKIKIVGACALVATAMLFVGCKASDQIKTVIENSYAVVQEASRAVATIKTQLDGSQLWTEVGKYVTSLDSALGAISTTLEKVAPIAGANLTQLSSVGAANGTANLDAATDKLLKSIK